MAKTIRDIYGETLVKYGTTDERIVVLDADVSNSTKSAIFAKAVPERFFNLGIAEANMAGIGAGLAAGGKIPFINTFAVFLTSLGLLAARTYGSYSNWNMKYVGAYGGLSNGFDGPTHHSIEDLAVFRTLPNFQVFVASDARQTAWLVKNAIDHHGPMYIRLTRNAIPDIYDDNATFKTGKGNIVRQGDDVTIIACGLMVKPALDAAETLATQGVSAQVVDMFCIKPLDKELILDCAKKTKLVVTVEEHSIIGGLGGAVAEVMATGGSGVPQVFIGLNDTHAETGTLNALFEKYGLTADDIVAKTLKGLGK
ncbi:MAG: transketolase family protein [Defluviitaleaceae bacterium]|nr:transketolase family protein [Defluviitaleaceae bacterium]